jgi:hypothetical protein
MSSGEKSGSEMKLKLTDSEFERMKQLNTNIDGIKERVKNMQLTALKNEIEVMGEEKLALIEKINQLNKKSTTQENLYMEVKNELEQQKKKEVEFTHEETGDKVSGEEMVKRLKSSIEALKGDVDMANTEKEKIYEGQRETADGLDLLNKRLLGFAINFESTFENKAAKGILKNCIEETKLLSEDMSLPGQLKRTDLLSNQLVNAMVLINSDLEKKDEAQKGLKNKLGESLDEIESLKAKNAQVEKLLAEISGKEGLEVLRRQAEEKERKFAEAIERLTSGLNKVEKEMGGANAQGKAEMQKKMESTTAQLEQQIEVLQQTKLVLNEEQEGMLDYLWKGRSGIIEDLTEHLTSCDYLREELKKLQKIGEELELEDSPNAFMVVDMSGPETKDKRYSSDVAKKGIDDIRKMTKKLVVDLKNVTKLSDVMVEKVKNAKSEMEELVLKQDTLKRENEELKEKLAKYAPEEVIVGEGKEESQLQKLKTANTQLLKENGVLKSKLANYRKEINKLLKENVLQKSSVNVSVLDQIKNEVEEGLVLRPGEEFMDPAFVQNEMKTKEEYDKLQDEVVQRDKAIENLLKVNDELETKFKKLNFKRNQLEKDKDNLAIFYKYLKSRSQQLEQNAKVFDDLVTENKKLKRLNEELHFKVQRDYQESIRLGKQQAKNMDEIESEIQQALINAKMDPDFDPENFATAMEGNGKGIFNKRKQ